MQTGGGDWQLILDHKDVENGYFSSNIKTDGLENENDPTANTYSIIGLWNDDSSLQDDYRDPQGRFKFRLDYTYFDNSTSRIIWWQTSWIADETIAGANLTLIPDQSGKGNYQQFHGLGLSTHPSTYLDGTAGLYSHWYHAVGTIVCVFNPCGIPGDSITIAAQSSSLYIWNPNAAGMKV